MKQARDAVPVFFSQLSQALSTSEKIDFYDFVKQAWHLVEPKKEFVDGWYIEAICQHLEAAVRGELNASNLLINVPRRFGKSLLVAVFFPAWCWTFQPSLRFLYASYSKNLSLRDSVRCRRVLDSDWYRARWGGVFSFTSDTNRQDRYDNDQGGWRIASSVFGSITGEGGDILVVDDPHNLREIHSLTRRQAVITWWDEVFKHCLDDTKEGLRIVVAQRSHQRDLSAHLLSGETGRWEHVRLPNEFQPEDPCKTSIWEDPRTEKDELLCFRRRGLEETEESKLQTYVYAAQSQQQPTSPKGNFIKRESWRFYPEVPKLDLILQSWDMAFKDTPGTSFVVGQIWGFRREPIAFYLLDQVRDRMTFTKTLRVVQAFSDKWPAARLKLIEDKASGTGVIDVLRKKIPGLKPIPVSDSKGDRLIAIEPLLVGGNVYLPKPEAAPWVSGYIEEFAAATPDGGGEYWDQVDTTTQALNYLYAKFSRKRRRVWGRERRPVASRITVVQ